MSKKPVQFFQCLCGCGNTTRREFAPGHDNRFYGQVVRGERDVQDLEAFPGLMRKWQGRQAKALAEVPAPPVDDTWTEDQPNQTTAPVGQDMWTGEFLGVKNEPTDLLPQVGATEVKDGRWWYKVKAIRPLSDGRYEVDWHAKNGGARTTRVTAEKLR